MITVQTGEANYKFCQRCHNTKPFSEFSTKVSSSTGIGTYCKPCQAENSRDWYLANRERALERRRLYKVTPETRRRYTLKYRYGLTPEQYDQMLAGQGGGCAICEKPPIGNGKRERLYVDHDHETGEVRGLLCVSCNNAIGMFRDNPERLGRAIAYLDQRLF